VLPSDCLKIIHVDNGSNYLRQGRMLYVNSPSVALSYLANINVEDLPLNLAYLIVLRLALELSFSFSADSATRVNIRELFEVELRKSANEDAKEGSEVINSANLFSSSWLESRN
jgi:hypothetical protein